MKNQITINREWLEALIRMRNAFPEELNKNNFFEALTLINHILGYIDSAELLLKDE